MKRKTVDLESRVLSHNYKRASGSFYESYDFYRGKCDGYTHVAVRMIEVKDGEPTGNEKTYDLEVINFLARLKTFTYDGDKKGFSCKLK